MNIREVAEILLLAGWGSLCVMLSFLKLQQRLVLHPEFV